MKIFGYVVLFTVAALGVAYLIGDASMAFLRMGYRDRVAREAHGPNVSRPESPTSYAPLPWSVGQWRRHRIVDIDGGATETRLAVVARDARGFWVEQEHRSYDGEKQVVRVLYASQPSSPEEAFDAALAMVVRFEDGTSVATDFATGGDEGRAKKGAAAAAIVSMAGLSGALHDPPQDVVVRGGRFVGCRRMTAPVARGSSGKRITGWYHPSVPLGGMVKGESPDGTSRIEVLDYGFSAAVTQAASSGR